MSPIGLDDHGLNWTSGGQVTGACVPVAARQADLIAGQVLGRREIECLSECDDYAGDAAENNWCRKSIGVGSFFNKR